MGLKFNCSNAACRARIEVDDALAGGAMVLIRVKKVSVSIGVNPWLRNEELADSPVLRSGFATEDGEIGAPRAGRLLP